MKINIEVDEPLALSAPLACRLAPGLCLRDPLTNQSCAWYHGVWQTMRLLELISSLRRENHFFLTRLHALASSGHYQNVLICGAADYALLARVAAAYSHAGQKPAISVLDRCPTSIYLNRWYAEKFGFSINTELSDIFEYRTPPVFDIVCAHSLLSFFPPGQRPLLAGALASFLRPGGKFITSQRVHAGRQAEISTFTGQEISAFGKRALAAAEQYRRHSDPHFAVRAAAAKISDYAKHYKRYPVRSDGEIKALLSNAGFTLDFYQGETGVSSSVDRPAGPADPRSSARVCVIASRS